MLQLFFQCIRFVRRILAYINQPSNNLQILLRIKKNTTITAHHTVPSVLGFLLKMRVIKIVAHW
ncbi:hypothetical protein T03_12572 [Trichinella britovi]|uniref:Uncharacterized protein n=1 Tax=Trichinella britovi TaxID=45882 RepID=A0A0V1D9Y2_TRIBR|nr:hypothetical protein T03_12572 [Trichinella britovi]